MDDNPKPLRVTMRVQNNALYSRRVEEGLSQENLAKRVGITLAAYGSLEGMREQPLMLCGDIRPAAKKLMEYYECEFEDLWPQVVRQVTTPVAVREMDAEQLALLLPQHETPLLPSPAELYDKKEDLDRITEAMKTLSDRDQDILQSYYLQDASDADLGKKYDISHSRIAQIRASAVRKVQVAIREAAKPREETKEYRQNKLISRILECLQDVQTVGTWFLPPGTTAAEISLSLFPTLEAREGARMIGRTLKLMRERGLIERAKIPVTFPQRPRRWQIKES